jgi:hypothetical protein
MKSNMQTKTRKIKMLALGLLSCLAMCSPSAMAASNGGDLGGGGTLVGIRRDFQIDADRKAFLQQQAALAELAQARAAWLETLSPEEHAKILNNVFKHMIAPQIIESNSRILNQ